MIVNGAEALKDQGHALKQELAASQSMLADLGKSSEDLDSTKQQLERQLAEALAETERAKTEVEERGQRLQQQAMAADNAAALHEQNLEHQATAAKLEADNRVLEVEKQVLEAEDRFQQHLQERDEELKMLTDMLVAVEDEKGRSIEEIVAEQRALREAQQQEHATAMAEREVALEAKEKALAEQMQFQKASDAEKEELNRKLTGENEKLKTGVKDLQREIQQHIFNAMEVRPGTLYPCPECHSLFVLHLFLCFLIWAGRSKAQPGPSGWASEGIGPKGQAGESQG